MPETTSHQNVVWAIGSQKSEAKPDEEAHPTPVHAVTGPSKILVPDPPAKPSQVTDSDN